MGTKTSANQEPGAASRKKYLAELWTDMEEIRGHVDRTKFSTVKGLIEEGRR